MSEQNVVDSFSPDRGNQDFGSEDFGNRDFGNQEFGSQAFGDGDAGGSGDVKLSIVIVYIPNGLLAYNENTEGNLWVPEAAYFRNITSNHADIVSTSRLTS